MIRIKCYLYKKGEYTQYLSQKLTLDLYMDKLLILMFKSE